MKHRPFDKLRTRPNLKNFLSTDIYGITADEYSLGRGNVDPVALGNTPAASCEPAHP